MRGIGVAESVSTSTSVRSCFSRSLAATPNRCSSSTTTRPRSLNATSLDSSRWVPMTMSTVPAARPGDRRLLLLRADTNRESSRTVSGNAANRWRERREVLAGQHRRRDQHRDLLAVLGRLERGPQRDLGLAVADVADDEPVHRPARLHVDLDLDRPRAAGRASPRTGTTPPSPSATASRGEYGKPSAASRLAYSASSSSARSATALRTRCFVRSQSVPPSSTSCGCSPPE